MSFLFLNVLKRWGMIPNKTKLKKIFGRSSKERQFPLKNVGAFGDPERGETRPLWRRGARGHRFVDCFPQNNIHFGCKGSDAPRCPHSKASFRL